MEQREDAESYGSRDGLIGKRVNDGKQVNKENELKCDEALNQAGAGKQTKDVKRADTDDDDDSPTVTPTPLIVKRLTGKECKDENDHCKEYAESGECEKNVHWMAENCCKACAEEAASCVDVNENCARWAKAGECGKNKKFMHKDCRKSCDVCKSGKPEEDFDGDKHEKCQEWAKSGECARNPNYMIKTCVKSCGFHGGAEQTENNVSANSEKPINNRVPSQPECKDNHEKCKAWSDIGECDKNPKYMHVNCRKACKTCLAESKLQPADCKDSHSSCPTIKANNACYDNIGWNAVFCPKSCDMCHIRDRKARCDPAFIKTKIPTYEYKNAYGKGDLNRLFEGIIKQYGDKITVFSKPPQPWIIKINDFVTVQEGERLLNLTLPHIKRSTDQGKIDEFGLQEQVVSDYRTSRNAWCMDDCDEDPVIAGLTTRISKLVLAPSRNFENYQVLEYLPTQQYKLHHDAGQAEDTEVAGGRVLTFFLYLNDVEDGGETSFPLQNVKVKPTRGSAILWPSALDEDPRKVDPRTMHEALPMGTSKPTRRKLSANLWIHLRNFRDANFMGCTGAFE